MGFHDVHRAHGCAAHNSELLFAPCCASVQAMVAAWEAGCGELDQYGMQYSRTFANLCNAGVPVQMLAKAAVQTCQAPTAAA